MLRFTLASEGRYLTEIPKIKLTEHITCNKKDVQDIVIMCTVPRLVQAEFTPRQPQYIAHVEAEDCTKLYHCWLRSAPVMVSSSHKPKGPPPPEERGHVSHVMLCISRSTHVRPVSLIAGLGTRCAVRSFSVRQVVEQRDGLRVGSVAHCDRGRSCMRGVVRTTTVTAVGGVAHGRPCGV